MAHPNLYFGGPPIVTYSMINAPALAFDLVRRPYGAEIATILLTALTAESCQLELLADQVAAPGSSRATRAAASECASPLSELAKLTMGDATSLSAFIRTEVLGPGSSADRLRPDRRDVVIGAVVEAAVWSWQADGPVDPPCAGSWPGEITRPLTTLIDTSPATVSRLSQIAGSSDHDRELWRLASGVAYDEPRWVSAMHQAAWALHLTGRTTVAAVAQLLAVQAFRHAGFTAWDAAHGVWNMVSGAVQATFVEDLLPGSDQHQLVRPWTFVQTRGPSTSQFSCGSPNLPG